jgi:hypothetical protein
MAWTASGLYLVTWIDLLDGTQLAIDLSLTSHKIALYDNVETPNYSSETAYAATNEVVGAGYIAGGQVVVTPSVTESPAGSIKYGLGDQVWASVSVTASGCKLYADALAGNNLILGINFAGAFQAIAAPFTIDWPSGVVFTLDCTP